MTTKPTQDYIYHDFIEEKYSAAARTEFKLRKTIYQRLQMAFYFLLATPYFFLFKFLIAITGIFSKNFKKKNTALFIKYYFKLFYYFKGAIVSLTNDIPAKGTKPIIFLTFRRDRFLPFFIYQIFPYPLIIPLVSKMLKGKISDFFTLRFGKALRSIAYPDINLGQNLANIEKIIERGYPVLVNINHGYLDPTFLRTIYFYEPLLKLIKRTDADIYFLNPREARQLKYSSIESAAPISIAIEKKENLFQDLPTNNDELLLKRVANFFGFMHYKILD